MAHRDGLEDWKLPPVPAGLPTREPVRAPAFFAWGSDTGVMPDSARKAANTPRTSESHVSGTTGMHSRVGERGSQLKLLRKSRWFYLRSSHRQDRTRRCTKRTGR